MKRQRSKEGSKERKISRRRQSPKIVPNLSHLAEVALIQAGVN